MTAPLSRLLVVGATSAIAEATVAALLAGPARPQLFLVGRRADALASVAARLHAAGGTVCGTAVADVADTGALEAAVAQGEAALGGCDGVLVATGVLPDEDACRRRPAALAAVLDVNATGTLVAAALGAHALERAGGGVLAVIASPAGERGRGSNYAYGAGKAAVIAWLSGARQALRARGVRVLTLIPGFTDTPMTAAFRKGPLWASPAQVGGAFARAMRRGGGTVYAPGYWRWIMRVIRWIPGPIYDRLRL